MIEVSLAGASTDESWNNYLRFTVTLSESPIDVVTLTYRTFLNGTAVDEDIYYSSSSSNNNDTLTFAPGETSKDIFIRADGDTVDEVDEAITLELSNLSSNAFFRDDAPVLRAFGVILDDDGPASNLAVFVSDPVVVEGSGPDEVAFDIQLSRPVETTFTLDYRTKDISATAGDDYTETSGSVEFRPGQSVARVVVPTSGDAEAEVSERFALVVEPPTTPVIDTAGAVGEALILDDDSGPGPVVTIQGGGAVESWNNYVRFNVILSEPPIDAVTMSYRTLLNESAGNEDLYFTSASSNNNGMLTFAPGETSRSIYVRYDGDSIDERDEAFTVELYNLSENAAFAGGGNAISAQSVILDDDGLGPNLGLFVSNPELIEGDTGEQLAVFDVTLSRPASSSFTVDYTTADVTASAGSDYTATSGSLTFDPGQDSAAVAVQVAGDTDSEATETFALNLTTPASVSVSQQGVSGLATILDNDTSSGPVLSLGQAAIAGETWNDYLRYTVTLSEAPVEPVTVAYHTTLGSASDDDLYSPSTSSNNNGTLTFEAGQISGNIYVRADGDTTDERDEFVVLTLRDVVGASFAGGGDSLSTVGFIQDDDGVGLNGALAGVPTTVTEPESGFIVV